MRYVGWLNNLDNQHINFIKQKYNI